MDKQSKRTKEFIAALNCLADDSIRIDDSELDRLVLTLEFKSTMPRPETNVDIQADGFSQSPRTPRQRAYRNLVELAMCFQQGWLRLYWFLLCVLEIFEALPIVKIFRARKHQESQSSPR
jgi:hypothetical protein